MSDHKHLMEHHLTAAGTATTPQGASVNVSMAQVHATMLQVESADAQVAAILAQTAAMERLGKIPRDTSTRAPGLGW